MLEPATITFLGLGRMGHGDQGGHSGLKTLQASRFSAEDLEGYIEKSLSHLQVFAIDLFCLHCDDPRVPVEVARGRIRYFVTLSRDEIIYLEAS